MRVMAMLLHTCYLSSTGLKKTRLKGTNPAFDKPDRENPQVERTSKGTGKSILGAVAINIIVKSTLRMRALILSQGLMNGEVDDALKTLTVTASSEIKSGGLESKEWHID
uniref:Uncharacterized protein n=1 Tax=Coccidioides posadasii RMSCC 3488 TaxID=454284 RepID=A0A0J6FRE6_COCPO|nr:hypothetical protein CPAG_08319 [Coccidioides posadasii RMSCC 3488]